MVMSHIKGATRCIFTHIATAASGWYMKHIHLRMSDISGLLLHITANPSSNIVIKGTYISFNTTYEFNIGLFCDG